MEADRSTMAVIPSTPSTDSAASDLLGRHGPDADFLARVPIRFARRHAVLALAGEGPELLVAAGEATAIDQVDAIGRLLGRPARAVIVPRDAVMQAIDDAYGQKNVEVDSVLDTIDQDAVLARIESMAGHEDLLDSASRAPVIQLVNLVLFEAVKQQASDVHVHPYENSVVVRLRADGVMFNAFELPKAVQEEMVSRIKVMGKMDIAEKRLPQDGRATVQVGERVIDLRIASLPTSFGERLVIRLLDKSARLYTLDELGMARGILNTFRKVIAIEHGLVLVTGPTGSGKSTTLYGALLELNSTERNILTLEDPIEYQLPGVSQTQINTRKGLTFAKGLRNVLRQDPDIIMVGEIRDEETARMAIQSALTGHLVFSTLHTNDAASAVTRMLDLGIEPYLVASSVVGVLAQRLVRRVCPHCAELKPLNDADAARLGRTMKELDSGSIRIGKGCDHCRQTGYRGRIGLFELLVVDDAVRRLVANQATASDIKQQAAQAGMTTLRDAGLAKLLAGETTADEIARVTARATH